MSDSDDQSLIDSDESRDLHVHFHGAVNQSIIGGRGHTQSAIPAPQMDNALTGLRSAAPNHAAVEVLWDSVLQVRSLSWHFLQLYTILLPEEYSTVFTNSKAKGLLPGTQGDQLLKQISELGPRVESKRPFIGERLWLLYSVYHRFALRTSWKVQEGWSIRTIREWHHNLNGDLDQALLWMLQEVCTEEEVNNFLRITDAKRIGVPQFILGFIEKKMIEALDAKINVQSGTDRPVFYPSGELPLIDEWHVDWNRASCDIEFHKVGGDMADTLCAALMPPLSQPPASMSDRYFLWRAPMFRPDESCRSVTLERGGLLLCGSTKIGRHTFSAPPEPSYMQMQQGMPYIIARLTITYRDINGNKHAGIFDYHSFNGWQRVEFLPNIGDDIVDLDTRARQHLT